jgi:hypothetical protein
MDWIGVTNLLIPSLTLYNPIRCLPWSYTKDHVFNRHVARVDKPHAQIINADSSVDISDAGKPET